MRFSFSDCIGISMDMAIAHSEHSLPKAKESRYWTPVQSRVLKNIRCRPLFGSIAAA